MLSQGKGKHIMPQNISTEIPYLLYMEKITLEPWLHSGGCACCYALREEAWLQQEKLCEQFVVLFES